MNLHATAALSWSGRRRLCELVVDEGWTVCGGGCAAGVSVRCARKWVGLGVCPVAGVSRHAIPPFEAVFWLGWGRLRVLASDRKLALRPPSC